MIKIEFQTPTPDNLAGKRLDQAMTVLIPAHSRSRIQSWIKEGKITVNNKKLRQRDIVQPGDIIQVKVALNDIEEIEKYEPEDIPLNVLYDDEDLIVINKPAGLVVHPGAGNLRHTLVNALLHFDKNLKRLPRAGIIHRLDKDTTGIMVIARTLTAHTFLVEKLQKREMRREYQAVICGQITSGSRIETNIGRHPVNRAKMAVTNNGKHAVTHFRIIKKYRHYTHLKVNLETGRTHQIRVHMAHIKHPVVGDPVYGRNHSLVKEIDPMLRDKIKNFNRQALHAHILELPHPATHESTVFEASLPEDVNQLIANLEKYD